MLTYKVDNSLTAKASLIAYGSSRLLTWRSTPVSNIKSWSVLFNAWEKATHSFWCLIWSHPRFTKWIFAQLWLVSVKHVFMVFRFWKLNLCSWQMATYGIRLNTVILLIIIWPPNDIYLIEGKCVKYASTYLVGQLLLFQIQI